eukprot:CAMPEP_0170496168 /NCGR_PEP_ID=MMETSP0208-20121228/20518_1 /TAXON_ID=197538 /ORGANISM="Strombidium inclinatum, Strain S3" /LENGTH=34 /DNA_ID= /DNA_START= /DNA_END= /DNA_ORIENTATION=
MDLDKLLTKKIKAPLKPKAKSTIDLKNFDKKLQE